MIGLGNVPAKQPPAELPPDSISDWQWAFDARSSGVLNAYAGQHVVVYGHGVVAADPDVEAAIRVAVQATGAAERDLAVLYVDNPESEGWLHVR